MLESLSNLQLLLLLFGTAATALVFLAWCIRRYILQVPQPSKNILWLVSAQMFVVGCASFLIDNGCLYLDVYSYVFQNALPYCTLPRYYWGGISALLMASLFVTILWLAKSPLNGGAGRVRHFKLSFADRTHSSK